jgi:hypothetical protein
MLVSVRLLVAALLLTGPLMLDAQDNAPRALTGRFSGAIHAVMTDPRGDFADNTGTGWGVNVTGLWRVDPAAIVHLRADAAALVYGSSTRRIDFPGTGGLIKLDLRTTSSIASFVGGPQLGGSAGTVSPWVAALGGFSVFWTQSAIEGSDDTDDDFASTTNSQDAVLSYGGGAGLGITVGGGTRAVRIDLGARYLRHDDVRYLNRQRIEDAYRNDQDPIPIRGRADFLTYMVGVSAILF